MYRSHQVALQQSSWDTTHLRDRLITLEREVLTAFLSMVFVNLLFILFIKSSLLNELHSTYILSAL